MRVALEEICRTYWMPVYSFIRQRGKSPEDSQDLTQAFFEHLLEKRWFSKADPSRGQLRSYLFASLIYFLTNDSREKHAKKRAGAALHLPFEDAEISYQHSLADHLTPDIVFQRRWALSAVENALAATRKEFLRNGPNPLFEALYPKLRDPGDDDQSARQIAEQCGTTAANARTLLHRMRQQLRHQLFIEVGQTIASMDPEEIRAEMRALMEYL